MIIIDIKKCYGCNKCFRNIPEFSRYIEAAIAEVFCRRCARPPCVEVCPSGALSRQDGRPAMRDEAACSACMRCSIVCPAGARPPYILRTVDANDDHFVIEKILKQCDRGAVQIKDDGTGSYRILNKNIAVHVD